jgi:hypothetical protein
VELDEILNRPSIGFTTRLGSASPEVINTDKGVVIFTNDRVARALLETELAYHGYRLAETEMPGEPEADPNQTQVPPEPGTTPIPEGNVRLYHYTGADPEQIRQQGLQMSQAKGETYGEPNQIWASARPPSLDNHNVVEFSVPRDDPRWNIGKYEPWVHYEGYDQPNFDYGQYLHDRGAHVTFNGDIRPDEIHAVHEPWHQSYRYLKENYPQRTNEFDWALDGSDPDLARAVRMWKQSKQSFMKDASWEDLMAKAKRILDANQVILLRNGVTNVVGNVTGDHGQYEVEIGRQDPASRVITTWSCGCPWAQFSFDRTRKWRKYEQRPCLVKETMISMADGTFKQIGDVVVGEDVLTHNGVGTVTQTMINPFEGDLAVIESFGYDEPLRITPSHKVYAYGTPQRFRRPWNGSKEQGFKIWDEDFLFEEDPEWIEPRDLHSHDWLTGRIRTETFGGPFDFSSIIPEDWEYRDLGGNIQRVHLRKNGKIDGLTEYKLMGTLPRLVEPSHELMTIMGLYAAEGSFGNVVDGYPGQVQWTFHIDEEGTLGNALQESLETLGLGKAKVHYHKTASVVRYHLTNHALALFLHTICGKYSQLKELHPWLVHLNPDYQETFLSWIWAGDGHGGYGTGGHPNDVRKHLSTASDQMAWQTHDMLLRCGYIPSWDRCQQNGGPNNRETLYTINRISWIEDRLDRRKGHGRRVVQDDLYAVKIRTVGSEPFSGDVYNLEVQPQHSYVANGKVVSNCSHVLALYWKSLSTPVDDADDQPEGGPPIPGPKPGGPPSLPGQPGGPPAPGAPKGGPGGGPAPIGVREAPSGPRTFMPNGDMFPAEQGQQPTPQAPPPQGPSQGGPQPQGVIPPFPGQQMQLWEQWQGPGTTDGGQPSPPWAVSVPGAKPTSPFNPVQSPGTYSKMVWSAQFQPEQIVQLMEDEYGVEQGGSGQYVLISARRPDGSPRTGMVRGQDEQTGWTEVMFSLDENGPGEARYAVCYLDPSQIRPSQALQPGQVGPRRVYK